MSPAKDQSFREALSPMARQACAIVSQIRFEELQTIWSGQTNGDEGLSAPDELFPGMMFTHAKSKMEKTKLFDIVRHMPKGAILHCHFEAMLDPEWLFREALSTDNMHIMAPSSLDTPAKRAKDIVSFDWTRERSRPEMSLWSSNYEPNALVPLKQAAADFPEGGQEGFIKWLVSRTTITPGESIEHHQGIKAVWTKFLSCFAIIRTVLWYEPILRKFTTKFLNELAADGIQYADVRMAFAFQYRKLESETDEEGYVEAMKVFEEEVKKFQGSEAGKNFWGARLIWTTIRSFDDQTIVKSMEEAIETKLALPDLVTGYDLVGFEEAGRPLADLVPLLLYFRKLCAENQVNLPFYFHAGETATSGTETDQNLFDAVLLGTRRLGHAFSLYKHPVLMNRIKEKNICVECCPVSNEVLRLCASITAHPLPAMLAHGVPVALSNDDPGMLGPGGAGLSHDFWQALQGIESLGMEGLAAMAENSVRFATYEDQDNREWAEDIKTGPYGTSLRAQRLKEWRHQWEKFAQWVVVEYGVDIDTELEGQD